MRSQDFAGLEMPCVREAVAGQETCAEHAGRQRLNLRLGFTMRVATTQWREFLDRLLKREA